jgi:hypothetical protein
MKDQQTITECESEMNPNCACHGCAERMKKRPFLNFFGTDLSPSKNARIIFRDSQ